ncbi:hypothetical protein CRUP_029605, partial [Coryphaenoides rupestris]
MVSHALVLMLMLLPPLLLLLLLDATVVMLCSGCRDTGPLLLLTPDLFNPTTGLIFITVAAMDNLSEALEKLKLGAGNRAPDSASMKIQEMGVLPTLPSLLSSQSSCAPKVANIIAEVAKNEFMRSPCVDAGLIPPLVQLLTSPDQELLLQTGRALGNICYDSHSLQAQLINMGVIPTLVKLLGVHAHNTALTEMCLIAFGNLAELGKKKKKKEKNVIKLQLVEAGMVECLLGVVGQTLEGEREEDVAQLKTASDLMVLLLLGDESMQKLFEGGKGSVFQRVLSWIPSNNHQLQLAGALAIANFARNVVNKAKMLAVGVANVVLRFLQSEMPPVQFKLLGTLRMLIDTQAEAADQLGTNVKLVERLVEWCEAKDHAGVMGESNRLLSALIRHSKSKAVVNAVIQGGGVKHLVTMATSEHMIMQNEALLLSDERSAPEIKYNSMILICAVMGSEPLHKEVQGLAFIDVVARLRAHDNKTVSHQASLTEQRLTSQ